MALNNRTRTRSGFPLRSRMVTLRVRVFVAVYPLRDIAIAIAVYPRAAHIPANIYTCCFVRHDDYQCSMTHLQQRHTNRGTTRHDCTIGSMGSKNSFDRPLDGNLALIAPKLDGEKDA